MSAQLPLVLTAPSTDAILRQRIRDLERRLADHAAQHDHRRCISLMRELGRLRQLAHRPPSGTS